jgi:hypothetical protein
MRFWRRSCQEGSRATSKEPRTKIKFPVASPRGSSAGHVTSQKKLHKLKKLQISSKNIPQMSHFYQKSISDASHGLPHAGFICFVEKSVTITMQIELCVLLSRAGGGCQAALSFNFLPALDRLPASTQIL